jgi:hypothetical protein
MLDSEKLCLTCQVGLTDGLQNQQLLEDLDISRDAEKLLSQYKDLTNQLLLQHQRRKQLKLMMTSIFLVMTTKKTQRPPRKSQLLQRRRLRQSPKR